MSSNLPRSEAESNSLVPFYLLDGTSTMNTPEKEVDDEEITIILNTNETAHQIPKALYPPLPSKKLQRAMKRNAWYIKAQQKNNGGLVDLQKKATS